MNMKLVAKILGKVGLYGFIAFVATFGLYIFNGENKLIYYVVRPLLNTRFATRESSEKQTQTKHDHWPVPMVVFYCVDSVFIRRSRCSRCGPPPSG